MEWRPPISFLTHQIHGPFCGIGSPFCSYFPPTERAPHSEVLSSEDVNVESMVEEPLPQSPQYEELLEVVTRAVAKLKIDWPTEVMSGRSAHSLWSGHYLNWHTNCLEMQAVFRALKHFLPDLRDCHVLVHTDNTVVVYYINHKGGLRSRPLFKLAHQVLVWSQGKLLSLRAVHVLGHLSMGADVLSRQGLRPRESMLHPEVVKQIWRVSPGLDAMVQTWPGLRLYAFPPIVLLPGALERVCRDRVRLLLEAPYWPGRISFSDMVSLLDGSPWEIPGAQLIASGLSTEVVETILQSRAPSTRKLYALKWRLFTSWCRDHQLDPVNFLIGTVLEFLQACFSTGLTHSTLKVYVAAILAYHTSLGGLSVDKNPLVTHFLHGVLRLRPRVPMWDLAVMLEALCRPLFKPIEDISDRFLIIKTTLLLTSLKRVGDLQALSVAPSNLDFAPGLAKAFLYPRAGYVPKVTSAAPEPVVIQEFCPPPFR
ncbi:ORF V: Enzymatic polyprotein [Labeo rohita]|uniref:ORF V: Enzymatic polyprotein n=1 Tax=Labeo rohita TaxID=84645 RepID=A0ABQ8MHD3_LABRO|nr:ORF V: Enzymatic polyprotein [Labeo rohita]